MSDLISPIASSGIAWSGFGVHEIGLKGDQNALDCGKRPVLRMIIPA